MNKPVTRCAGRHTSPRLTGPRARAAAALPEEPPRRGGPPASSRLRRPPRAPRAAGALGATSRRGGAGLKGAARAEHGGALAVAAGAGALGRAARRAAAARRRGDVRAAGGAAGVLLPGRARQRLHGGRVPGDRRSRAGRRLLPGEPLGAAAGQRVPEIGRGAHRGAHGGRRLQALLRQLLQHHLGEAGVLRAHLRQRPGRRRRGQLGGGGGARRHARYQDRGHKGVHRDHEEPPGAEHPDADAAASLRSARPQPAGEQPGPGELLVGGEPGRAGAGGLPPGLHAEEPLRGQEAGADVGGGGGDGTLLPAGTARGRGAPAEERTPLRPPAPQTAASAPALAAGIKTGRLPTRDGSGASEPEGPGRGGRPRWDAAGGRHLTKGLRSVSSSGVSGAAGCLWELVLRMQGPTWRRCPLSLRERARKPGSSLVRT